MVVGGVLGALLVPPFLELVVRWARHVDTASVYVHVCGRESDEDLCLDCINGGSSHALCGLCVWDPERGEEERERES